VKRLLVIGVPLLLVLGTGGYAVARTRDPATSYRTATATRASVERTLDLSGTVTATGRRDLSFGTSGTVSSVPARLGQRVHKGQVLARLDPTALDASVTSAVAALDKAKAQLVSDEDAQSTTVTTASTSSSSKKSIKKKKSAQSSHSQTSPGLQQALAKLKEQQTAVLGAESDASDALAAAKDALAAEVTACTINPGADPTGPSAACSDALAKVQDAQSTVATKQDALKTALTTLTSTLGAAEAQVVSAAQQASQAAQQTQQQATPKHASNSGGSTGTSTPSSGSGAAGGGEVTAARLAQDQASIDGAEADLTRANAERSLATLRAPYAGQVLQVGVARHDQVGASDVAVVLVGRGVTTVTSTLSTAQVPTVRQGQRVTVVPAGWSSALAGTVSQVGLLPDSSGNHTVTITVATARTVAEGTTASVAIVTGTARDAVTVPTSAVTKIGSRALVRVLHGTTLTSVLVTTGVTGTRRTSITSGLRAGQQVVIADLSAALPSTTSTQNGTTTRFRRAGGLTGGGGFGGPRG
jgi:HlyD family secretion protein